MELVIDATVVFTGIIGKGVTKEIIFSGVIDLYTPEYLFEEIEEHKSRLSQLSKLSSEELDNLLERLKSWIKSVSRLKFEQSLKESNLLISDKDDTEYLALALSFDKMPIWSNDPHFKEQSVVEVFTTKELVDHLKSLGYKFSTVA